MPTSERSARRILARALAILAVAGMASCSSREPAEEAGLFRVVGETLSRPPLAGKVVVVRESSAEGGDEEASTYDAAEWEEGKGGVPVVMAERGDEQSLRQVAKILARLRGEAAAPSATQLQAAQIFASDPTVQSFTPLERVSEDRFTGFGWGLAHKAEPTIDPDAGLGKAVEELQGWQVERWVPVRPSVEGEQVWSGLLAREQGIVTLVEKAGRFRGWFDVRGVLSALRSLGGDRYALVSLDTAALEDRHFEVPEDYTVGAAALPDLPAMDGPCPQTLAEDVEVDVLLLYTRAAAEAYRRAERPWGPALEELKDALFLHLEVANQILRVSDVPVQLRLTSPLESSLVESGSNVTDVDTLLDPRTDAAKEASALRQQLSADLVVVVTDNPGVCGYAGVIGPDEPRSFAAVSWQCLPYYTLGHEIGHLLGARHERDQDPEGSPFPYQHGHVQASRSPRFRTLMSVGCRSVSSDCPRIPYLSNPRVEYYGFPTGVARESDNACVLSRMAGFVAGFR